MCLVVCDTQRSVLTKVPSPATHKGVTLERRVRSGAKHFLPRTWLAELLGSE